ncbi:MAG: TIGR00282 family metallophosphoesterase [Mycoplasmataceae bacterium]|nr:TIGR00282 family metallophosphoesterase [Mycoplasmataceae bacterium]
MKILIIGDIYGQPGKRMIQSYLPSLKQTLKPDIVIANAENTSIGGKSLIKKDYDLLKAAGVDYFTMGNHTFKNREINDYIDDVPDLIRPANWPGNVKGRGFLIFEYNNKKILLLNLLGQSFMNIPGINPFTIADEILNNNKYDLAIVDYHAEATAEKIIVANYLSKKVQIFFGTHTHVQTADERILNKKTAYITDVGFTGVFDSAIGADFKAVTAKMKDDIKSKFIEAQGPVRLNAILVTLYDNTLKPYSIERIQFTP